METTHKYLSTIGIILFWLCLSPVCSGDDTYKNAEEIISDVSPSGWTIVKKETGQIPWGHHWCKEYNGITGIKLTVLGMKPVSSHFLGVDGKWKKINVGKEALEIWIMPSNYSENWVSQLMCFHKPIQPTDVIRLDAVRVYAKPSHYSNAEEKEIFNKYLSASSSVKSPESPSNDPSQLSWKKWKSELILAFENEYNR